VLVVGLLVTGLVVALGSRDSRLALRAILVGLVILSLISCIFGVVSDAVTYSLGARQLLDNVLRSGVLVLVLLIPIALGFRVGRMVKNARAQEG
jgi:hypothetical protein